MMKFFKIDNLFATALMLIFLSVLPYIFQIDFLNPVENTIEQLNATDLYFSKFSERYEDKDQDIVLVNIGFLNRRGIADIINTINQFKPKVIGIDIIFRKDKGDELDIPLTKAFANSNNLVLGMKLLMDKKNVGFTDLDKSLDKFNRYANNGFTNLIEADQFRLIRHYSPFEKVNSKLENSFSSEIARLYDNSKVNSLSKRNFDSELINYRRTIQSYHTFDHDEIYSENEDLNILKDKIVLIGFLGKTLDDRTSEDIFFTPMNERYVGRSMPDMYGMVIHANILSMVLSEDYILSTPYWFKSLALLLIIYFNMAVFLILRARSEALYESVSLLIIIAELIIFFLIMIFFISVFRIELGLGLPVLISILFSSGLFELYHGSVKPLILNRVSYFRNLRIRK